MAEAITFSGTPGAGPAMKVIDAANGKSELMYESGVADYYNGIMVRTQKPSDSALETHRIIWSEGAPDANAEKGDVCIDYDTPDIYINSDGGTTWKKITRAS